MKCYYTIDPKTLKKVLIPMCHSVCESHNKKDCTCPDPLTEHQFEKERYNKVLAEKNQTIEAMQAEIKNLNKIIVSLKKTNHEKNL